MQSRWLPIVIVAWMSGLSVFLVTAKKDETPRTAPVAAPYNIVRQVVDTVMMPVRLWRWLTGARAASSPG